MSAFLLLLKRVPAWVWIALALVVVGWRYGESRFDAGMARQKAVDAKVFVKLAELTEKTRIAVDARERSIRGMLDSSNQAREQGIAHAVGEQQRIVADVRSGTVRLRDEWAGCPASNPVSGDAAGQSRADGEADVRATAAGAVVRVGDDADLQVRGLQDALKACQALTQPLD